MRLFGKGHDELRNIRREGDMDGRTPAIRKQLLSLTFMEPSNIPIFCASPHSVQRPVLASINHPNLHKLHATSSYSSENTNKNHATMTSIQNSFYQSVINSTWSHDMVKWGKMRLQWSRQNVSSSSFEREPGESWVVTFISPKQKNLEVTWLHHPKKVNKKLPVSDILLFHFLQVLLYPSLQFFC